MVGAVKKRFGGREVKTKNKKRSLTEYYLLLSAPSPSLPSSQGQGRLPGPQFGALGCSRSPTPTPRGYLTTQPLLNLKLLPKLPFYLVFLQQIKCSAHLWLQRPQPTPTNCPAFKSAGAFFFSTLQGWEVKLENKALKAAAHSEEKQHPSSSSHWHQKSAFRQHKCLF